MKVRARIPTFIATSSKKFILPWLLCLLAIFPIDSFAQEEEKEPGMFINIFMDWIAISYATHTGETYGEAIDFFSELVETYKVRPDLKPLLDQMKDLVASNALQVGSHNFYNYQGVRIYFVGIMEVNDEKKYVNPLNKLLDNKVQGIKEPYIIVWVDLKGTHLKGYTTDISIEGSPEIKMGKYKLDKTNDRNPFHQVKGEFTTRSEMGKSVRVGLLAGLNTLLEEVKSLKPVDEETKEIEEPDTLDNNAVDSISTTPPTRDLASVQSRLIYEVLVEIDLEIGHWLNNDQGPLPGCLPESPDHNQLSQEKTSFYIKNNQELVDSISITANNAAILDSLSYSLSDTLNYKPQLSSQQWKEIREMICPFVSVESDRGTLPDAVVGMSRDIDYAIIHTVTPSIIIEDERVEITYSLNADSVLFPYRKIEILKVSSNDTTLVYSVKDIKLGQNIAFDDSDNESGWDGKSDEGNWIEKGDYKITLTVAQDKDYKNGYTDFDMFEAKEEGLTKMELEALKTNAEDGIEAGESWNPDSYACNNAVRAYLYYQENDAVLFPETMPDKESDFPYGSGLDGPNDDTVLKGKISWDGVADEIYLDFAGKGNDLGNEFEEIEKGESDTWNTYFDQLQKLANKGVIIIGVIHSDDRTASRGHIVALVPKSICEDKDLKEETKKIGNDSVKTVLPCALEAGADVKEIKYFNHSSTETPSYKWYKYEN